MIRVIFFILCVVLSILGVVLLFSAATYGV